MKVGISMYLTQIWQILAISLLIRFSAATNILSKYQLTDAHSDMLIANQTTVSKTLSRCTSLCDLTSGACHAVTFDQETLACTLFDVDYKTQTPTGNAVQLFLKEGFAGEKSRTPMFN